MPHHDPPDSSATARPAGDDPETVDRKRIPGPASVSDDGGRTGEEQAAINRANEPPA
jgi:hypothetical protein